MVEIQPSVYHGDEARTANDLENRTNLAGVYFTQEKVSEGVYKITTRSNGVVNAMKDHMFLVRNFEGQYGRVYDIRIMARSVRKNDNDFNIRYIIKDDTLVPYREWENYTKYEFNDYGVIIIP